MAGDLSEMLRQVMANPQFSQMVSTLKNEAGISGGETVDPAKIMEKLPEVMTMLGGLGQKTETTGAQKQTNTYGATSATKGTEQFTKGSETFDKGSETITKGQQINTEGELTTTHNVTGFNSNTLVPESSDTKGSQTITEGQRIDTEGQRQDTYGQRIDTYGSRTDTTLEHVDTVDNDEWTLSRKGNIGVQTAGDILRIHTEFWTEHYKFMSLIFEDICKALLLVGDC